MEDPWYWIGITFLATLIALLATALWLTMTMLVIPWAWKTYYHLRDRGKAPQVDDLWMQGDTVLKINEITDKGRIVIGTGMLGLGCRWSDSPSEWKERVKHRKLWRLLPGVGTGPNEPH